MQVIQVDQRDGGWEDSDPRFRVYLHSSGETSTARLDRHLRHHQRRPAAGIDWAQRQAGGHLIYAIALVRDAADEERRNLGYGRGLVWLVGMDGNDSADDHPQERAVQQRMLSRRKTQSGYPTQIGRRGT
jgi:hypothetical protein